MRSFFIFFKKELLSELRSGETWSVLAFLSLCVSALLSVGVQLSTIAPADTAKLGNAFLWIIVLLVASIATSRAFEPEVEQRGIDATILTGAPLWQLYLAKTAALSIFIWLGAFAGILSLHVLLDLNFISYLLPLSGITLLVSLGYSALATLLTALTIGSRLRSIILPCILLPLLFPLLFAAVQLTRALSDQSFEVDNLWLSLLLGLDLLYTVLGLNLYEHILRE